jgi:hypothetical protein
MRGFITEEKFKVALQRSEKNTAKCGEIRGMLLLLVATTTDIVIRLQDSAETHPMDELFPTFAVEMKSIQEYTNEQLQDISKTYKCASLQFDDILGFVKKEEKK